MTELAELTDREQSILDILIGTYVRTGEPVGSRTISKIGIGLSSATIRNSMADLEEKGYLYQPHTSAGRAPSDKGYRFYVDRLMSREELAETARRAIRESVQEIREGNVQSLLSQVSHVIAEVSQNLGLVLSPRFEQGRFERLEMVKLSESKLLLVLTIRSGLVKTLVIEIDSDMDSTDLDETRRVVNERLFGLTIGEILTSVRERLESATEGSPKLLRLISDSADSLFQVTSVDELHLDGARNMFRQPDFTTDRLAGLIGMLEERHSMVSFLGERIDQDGIAITIGDENASPGLQGCSVLTSRYQVGNVSGVIGVIGPTRLPYARLVPLVQYIADLTGEMLDR
ncbi:MAG: heat-inducible transcriptional repressor HrcA [bacterium]|nr:heat-inducible transcriptional repressor HrcA [bacterium]